MGNYIIVFYFKENKITQTQSTTERRFTLQNLFQCFLFIFSFLILFLLYLRHSFSIWSRLPETPFSQTDLKLVSILLIPTPEG